jgi:hypothetical protein
MAKSSNHRPECRFVVAKPGGTEVLMKEDFVMIQALVKRGVYQQDIATLLGVHPQDRRARPGTGHPGFTAVGIPAALRRFAMLQCFHNVRPSRLPAVLRDQAPHDRVCRLVGRGVAPRPGGVTAT